MADRDAVTAEDLASARQAQDPGARFADNCYLTYLIPAATDLELDRAFQDAEGAKSILGSIEQRDTLFFDETVHVLLVLKMPWLEEKELQAQMRRLVLSLDAQVVSSSPPGRDSSPAAEPIFSGRVPDVSDPFIVVDEELSGDGDGASQHVYAAWKLPVFLARPRVRTHAPSVVFSASASLRPDSGAEPAGAGYYLPSGLPASANLLESFSGDPALGGVRPRLSALRVSRVAPLTRHQDLTVHLRALPQLKLAISPVVHTRVRFSRPNTTPPSSAIVALLEMDFTAHFGCDAMLDDISLRTADGTVENLNDEAAMGLPLRCLPHDHVTFLYLIKPHQSDTSSKTLTGTLDISISISLQVVPGVCAPRLWIAWTSALDFTAPVNPSFATSVETGIQRSRRPSQLSIGSATALMSHRSQPTAPSDVLPALDASATRTEAAGLDLGITMSFTGPTGPVYPGDVFSWTVYVVNRSSDKAARPPRKLALVAIPSRRRNEVRPVRPPSTASRRRGEKEVADAVMDENVLHAMQRNSLVDAADVVCLSADTRVGPLGPGACHAVELHFLALREGIVGVEAIRVVDMASQEHVDIRDLPTVTVEPRQPEVEIHK